MTWREHAPGPGRFWLRWSPRRWPAPPAPAVDLAERRLLWPASAGEAIELSAAMPPRPDLVGLPPVPAALAAERAALAAALAAAGMSVLAQDVVGAEIRPAGVAVGVLDLTAALLAPATGLDRIRAAAPARAGAALTWVALPLLAGVTPTGAALDPWLDAIVELRPDALLLPAPELGPADRRRLAEAAGEERYEAIFHGPPVDARAVARAAARRGLPLVAGRPPLPAAAPRAARNRQLAAALAEAGDLWLRLGRSEPEGEALLAAARHLDATALDLAALAREGNLGVVDWLSASARRLIEESLGPAPAATLDALRTAWTADEEGGAP